MTVDAQLVKTLRAKTSAGVMQCKQALTEANGDLEAAIEIIRKQGAIAAQKKSARESKEGMVLVGLSDQGDFGVLVEVNCETDFVAMGERFKTFAQAIGQTAIAHRCENLDVLMNHFLNII